MDKLSLEIREMMKEDRGFRISFSQERFASGFIEQLTLKMQAGGMNKADLARAMGKSAAYVSKVMNKEQNLTIRTMVELADAVGMEPILQLKPSVTHGRPSRHAPAMPSARQEVATDPRPVADA